MGGGSHEEGGCLKYLKRGWNRKEGNKDFRRGKGQAGSRSGCLRKGRAGTHLRTMVTWQIHIYKNSLHSVKR